MTIAISNKSEFVNKFLTPLSRINNSCSLLLKDNFITALVATPDASVILNAKITYNNAQVDSENKLNIPDINKLIRVLDCIKEEDIVLKINSNNVSYSGDGVKFKYHLLEDGIITTPAINIEKVKDLKYDTEIVITANSMSELLKSSSFSSETDKLYIRTDGSNVLGELTDKNKSNVDSIELKLASEFNGSEIKNALPLNFEIMRIVSCNKLGDITIKINIDLGVLLFKLNNNNIELLYVASGLAET